VAQRGLHTAADAAYVAGYWAALRTVATSLGLNTMVVTPPPSLVVSIREHPEWEMPRLEDGS